jgi:hypothetical protein
MYYFGMMDHWGHRGWGGFPNWGSPLATVRWLLGRPLEVGNYGTREIGVVLLVLAVLGGLSLAKRSAALVVLLTAPFALAVSAALVGKYPLANRTTFFLLPGLWLLAAVGVGQLVDWGRRRGWNLAVVGLLLVAWDFTWLCIRLAQPDPGLDYRGAFRVLQTVRGPGEQLWVANDVVYQVYCGTDAPVLRDWELGEALRRVKHEPLWAVIGDTQHALRRRFEVAGGRVVQRYHVSGLDVLRFVPATAPQAEGPGAGAVSFFSAAVRTSLSTF